MPSIFSLQRRAIRKAEKQFTSDINEIVDQILQREVQALAPIQPIQQLGGGASSQLSALLGFGGDSQGALQTLQQTPGFQFQVDQANQALQRQQSQLGQLLSGNQLAALSELNQGLAGQRYDQTIQNLLGVNQQALQGTSLAAALTAQTNAPLVDLRQSDALNRADSLLKQENLRAQEIAANPFSSQNLLKGLKGGLASGLLSVGGAAAFGL